MRSHRTGDRDLRKIIFEDRKPLPDANPIHPPPLVGSPLPAQPISTPVVVGSEGDLGQDQKEATLVSAADHRPAASVCPKKSRPVSKRSPSPSEDESSDSSDLDSHPESGDRWAKTQREANREGDWELASSITAFPVIHRKVKRALAYASWELLKNMVRAHSTLKTS
ncbi:hypothetical protein TURU_036773 [Turdus rufiventris]|nr:hypothetical protein TURU_036773 [Turdus rufiventris]